MHANLKVGGIDEHCANSKVFGVVFAFCAEGQSRLRIAHEEEKQAQKHA